KVLDPNFHGIRGINSHKAVSNCLDEQTVAEILKVNNIGYMGNEKDYIKSYEVLISDLNILSIRQVYNFRSVPKTRYLKVSQQSKLCELAKRVFLILGLDIGLIKLAYTSRSRIKVVSINPSPVLRERDLNKILDKIDEIYLLDKTLPAKDIKLGADPEFMLFNTKSNRMLSASRFFPRDGLVGCDNIRMPNRQQRPVAEIRPQPSICPLKLSSNIKKALDTANRMAPYRNVKWMAGSQPGGAYSIGGHIHFSNIKLNAGVIRALDNYVSIPLFLIEEPVSAARRRRRYGYLGDYRVKDHGGFEYRTPASWLVSQQITIAVLCLAKIVASSYHILSKNYLNSVDAQRAFYTGDQNYFRPIFLELWSDIEKTEMYKQYKEELKNYPRYDFG
ncbi:MAG: putative amidoligase domain-containing protein, partial [Syntrophomonadaceae bacterium]